MILHSAEIYRRRGHEDRARELISEAVENLPGRTPLLEFESRMCEASLPNIKWRELLLPARTDASLNDSQTGGTDTVQEPETSQQ